LAVTGAEKRFPLRFLTLDGEAAFQLTNWCGTCPLTFERLEGANRTLSVGALRDRLATGLDRVEPDVLETVSGLFPPGEYLPLLVEATPGLTMPGSAGDYFVEEEVRAWGIDPFWGLPANPRTPYYRVGDRSVTAGDRLFEFVVPMVPPSWNDRATVDRYARAPGPPTALALGFLDVCEPATETGEAGPDGDRVHRGLMHFLLDGHHKLQAAAESGRPVRVLSLLSIDGSRAARDHVLAVPDLLRSG
jgi:hypothetical protein